MIEGSASIRNSQRQPLIPPTPFIEARMNPEIGDPIALARGTAIRKLARNARAFAGGIQ